MNTPAYFCIDNFGAEGEEVLPEKNIATAIDRQPVATAGATQRFDLGGRLLTGSQKGIGIVRMADGSVRKMVR
jgi:hypothetical protein